jgi:competence protein ComEA
MLECPEVDCRDYCSPRHRPTGGEDQGVRAFGATRAWTVMHPGPDAVAWPEMPTPTERSALLFVGAIACLGGGVRILRPRTVPPPTAAEHRALDAQLAAQDSAKRTKAAMPKSGRGAADSSASKKPKPVAVGAFTPGITVVRARQAPSPGHKLDLDVATPLEIQALPGIGPSLAGRIVANRDSSGPFGSLAGLQRVRGIGPVIAARIDSLVTFSGTAQGVTRTVPSPSDSSAAARKRKAVRPP